VTAALLEGLAGVEDTGAGFRSARVSPRWLAAGTKEVEVSVRYPASQGYVHYHYREEGATITLDYTSCADKATLRVPLPMERRVDKALLNGKEVHYRGELVEKTGYAVVEVEGRGAHRLQLELAL
jgi:hypothetical protein